MFLSIAAVALALQGVPAASPSESNLLSPVQYCSHGYDIDIHGRCYPNGVIPPQYQAARQGWAYGGGRYYEGRRYHRGSHGYYYGRRGYY